MDISVRPQGKGLRCLQRTKTKCPYEIHSVQGLPKKKIGWVLVGTRVSNQLIGYTYDCAAAHSFTRANPLWSSRQTHQSYFTKRIIKIHPARAETKVVSEILDICSSLGPELVLEETLWSEGLRFFKKVWG